MKRNLFKLIVCLLTAVVLVGCANTTTCGFCGEEKKCEIETVFGEKVVVCKDCINELSDELQSSNSQPPSAKEIEITIDNWDIYFEFVEKEEEYRNEYNEIEHIQHYYELVLKEGYSLAKEPMNIKFEYSYKGIWYSVQEDLVNKEIVWGEPLGSEQIETNELTIKWAETKVAGESLLISGHQKYKCSDFEILRIYGTLSIIE